MPQRFKVIACGVFERELLAAAAQSDNDIDLECLDAGLHAAPHELRRRAQEAIDRADSQPFDAVLLCYGLCGRGVVGLRARSKPLVLPRAHDCIALFLGSRREYRRQFAAHPGTYYMTPGWYEKKSGPQDNRLRKLDTDDAVRRHPRFREYAERFGDDNAAYIIRFYDRWKRHYSRAAFIDNGLGDSDAYARYARDLADELGWTFERLPGDLRLFRMLLDGEWPADEFLVAPPGSRIVDTGKDDVTAAVPTADGDADREPVSERVTIPLRGARPRGRRPALGLGVDAGGTYTDSVLYDFQTGRVLAKAKALTTPQNYAEGIVDSVRRLDPRRLARVDVVCLSTTLATNAIVEGRGGRVGLLLMPHSERARRQIRVRPCEIVPGRIDITGREIEPLDEDAARRAVRRLLLEERVDALAVSGFGSVKNPAHERRLKALAAETAARAGLPEPAVVCGHELSSGLDFIKRAHTAALNARLLPIIRSLLDSVKTALAELGVDATLMVVKGDGALVSEQVARERPIETILSGPAASAAGAVFLSGLTDAVAVDMGGTTTDTALLRGGRVAVAEEGAQVGEWRTSVQAVDMLTAGLGGDSLVGLDREGRITIGPRRVVPLACLAAQRPETVEVLERVRRSAADAALTIDCLDFFAPARRGARADLDAREQEILDALADGPRSRVELARSLGYMAPSLLRVDRLEALGLVQRAALTPTDVLHFAGEYVAWSREAATLGMEIFASLLGEPAEAAAARIRREITRRLSLEIVRRYVSLSVDPAALESCPACRLFLSNLFEGERRDEFACRFQPARPIVGLGAPAEAFLRDAAAALDADIVIPPHADVANAVGAVTSKVVIGERAVIRPSEIGGYLVHAAEEQREFDSLAGARAYAERAVAGLLQRLAPVYGADAADLRLRVDERMGLLAGGERVFLEMVVEGSLEGPPLVAARA